MTNSLEANQEVASEPRDQLIEAVEQLFKETTPIKDKKMSTFRLLTNILETSLQHQNEQTGEIDALRQTIKDIEQKNELLKKDLDQIAKERESVLLKEIEKLEATVNEKDNLLQSTDIKGKIEEYSERINKLTEENENFKLNETKITEARDALAKQIDELTMKYNGVNEDNSKIKQQFEEAHKKLDSLEKEKDGLQKDKLSLQKDTEDSQKDKHNLESQVKQLNEQLGALEKDLHAKISVLENEKNDVQGNKVSLEEQLKNSSHSREKLEDDVAKLQKHVTELEEKQNNLVSKADYSKLEEEKAYLNKKIESLEKELNDEQNRLKVLETNNQSVEADLKKAREELLAVKEKEQEMVNKDKYTKIETEKDSLSQENNKIKEELEHLKAGQKQLQDQEHTLKEQNVQLHQTLEKAQEDLKNKVDTEEYTQVLNSNKTLTEQHEKLNKDLEEAHTVRKDLEAKEEKLRHQVTQHENDLAEAKKRIEHMVNKDEYDKLASEKEELINKNITLKEEASKAHSHQTESAQNVQELQGRLKSSEDELLDIKKKVQEMVSNDEYTKLKHEKELLEKESIALKADIAAATTRKQELEHEKTESEGQKNQLQKQLQDLLTNNQSEGNNAKILVDQNTELQSKISTLETNRQSLEGEKSHLKTEVERLQMELNNTQDNLKNTVSQADYKKLELDKDHWADKSKKLEEELNHLQAIQKELQAKKEELEGQKAHLDHEVKELQSRQQTMTTLEEYNKLKIDLDLAATKNDTLQQEKEEVNHKLKEAEEKNTVLQGELTKSKEQIANLQTLEKAMVPKDQHNHLLDGQKRLEVLNTTLQTDLDAAKLSQAELSLKKEELQKQLDQKQLELTKLQREVQETVPKEDYNKLVLERDSLSESREQTDKKIKDLQDNEKVLEEQKEALHKEVEQLRLDVLELKKGETDMISRKTHDDEVEKHRKQLEEFEKLEENLKSDKSKLEQENVTLANTLEGLQKENHTILEQKNQIQSEFDKLQNAQKDLNQQKETQEEQLRLEVLELKKKEVDMISKEDHKVECDKYLTKINDLEKLHEETRTEKIKLEGEYTSLQNNLKDAHSENANVLEQKNQLQITFDKLQSDYQAINQQKQTQEGELQQKVLELQKKEADMISREEHKTEVEKHLTHISELERLQRQNLEEKQRVEQEIANLNKDLADSRASVSQLSEKIAQLEQNNTNLTKDLTDSRNNLEKTVDKLASAEREKNTTSLANLREGQGPLESLNRENINSDDEENDDQDAKQNKIKLVPLETGLEVKSASDEPFEDNDPSKKISELENEVHNLIQLKNKAKEELDIEKVANNYIQEEKKSALTENERLKQEIAKLRSGIKAKPSISVVKESDEDQEVDQADDSNEDPMKVESSLDVDRDDELNRLRVEKEDFKKQTYLLADRLSKMQQRFDSLPHEEGIAKPNVEVEEIFEILNTEISAMKAHNETYHQLVKDEPTEVSADKSLKLFGYNIEQSEKVFQALEHAKKLVKAYVRKPNHVIASSIKKKESTDQIGTSSNNKTLEHMMSALSEKSPQRGSKLFKGTGATEQNGEDEENAINRGRSSPDKTGMQIRAFSVSESPDKLGNQRHDDDEVESSQLNLNAFKFTIENMEFLYKYLQSYVTQAKERKSKEVENEDREEQQDNVGKNEVFEAFLDHFKRTAGFEVMQIIQEKEQLRMQNATLTKRLERAKFDDEDDLQSDPEEVLDTPITNKTNNSKDIRFDTQENHEPNHLSVSDLESVEHLESPKRKLKEFTPKINIPQNRRDYEAGNQEEGDDGDASSLQSQEKKTKIELLREILDKNNEIDDLSNQVMELKEDLVRTKSQVEEAKKGQDKEVGQSSQIEALKDALKNAMKSTSVQEKLNNENTQLHHTLKTLTLQHEELRKADEENLQKIADLEAAKNKLEDEHTRKIKELQSDKEKATAELAKKLQDFEAEKSLMRREEAVKVNEAKEEVKKENARKIQNLETDLKDIQRKITDLETENVRLQSEAENSKSNASLAHIEFRRNDTTEKPRRAGLPPPGEDQQSEENKQVSNNKDLIKEPENVQSAEVSDLLKRNMTDMKEMFNKFFENVKNADASPSKRDIKEIMQEMIPHLTEKIFEKLAAQPVSHESYHSPVKSSITHDISHPGSNGVIFYIVINLCRI